MLNAFSYPVNPVNPVSILLRSNLISFDLTFCYHPVINRSRFP